MDLIIYNANIRTMDSSLPNATALAIKDGIILNVGSDQEILKLKTNETEVFDLKGKLLLPGFNDSHMHLLNYGVSLQLVDLQSSNSIDDLINKVKNFIKDKNIPKDEWVRGMRWNHHLFEEKKIPTRNDLDKISEEHPIILSRVCGHVIVANSKAMELAGVNENTPQVKGGHFDLDTDGVPLGVFRENAISLIYDKLPKPSVKDIKNLIKLGASQLLKFGITSVQSDDLVVFPEEYELVLQAYEQLINEEDLPIRVYQQSNFKSIDSYKEFLKQGYHQSFKHDFFRIGPLKLLADGSLGARTAYLFEAYSDDPSTHGIPIFTQEELDEMVLTAEFHNMDVAIHAIGDKTIGMALNSIKAAKKASKRKHSRHSIVHCQITNDELLDQFRSDDVIALVQPLFVSTDLHIVEERVGTERAKKSYNWKGLLDRNVHMAFGSDTPVETPNVLQGIYAAITRKDMDGYPENGWLPDQKISIQDAVYCYTMGSAYASYEEDKKGSITPGKFADMVILEDDIFKINPDLIKNTKVAMTIVNGKILYRNI